MATSVYGKSAAKRTGPRLRRGITQPQETLDNAPHVYAPYRNATQEFASYCEPALMRVLRKRTRNGCVEKAHALMKRIHITTSPKELAGLHRLVFQVAFGLLLAFYNREKPIQCFDVPLLHLRNERCGGEAVLITLGAHAQRGYYSSWVCVSVCVSVTQHLTSPMFVRLTNDRTYLTGNEGQKICAVFSENAPLQS